MSKKAKISTKILVYTGSKGLLARLVGGYLVVAGIYDFSQLATGNFLTNEMQKTTESYIGLSFIFIIMIIAGVMLARRGYRTKQMSERFMQYADLIENQNITSMFKISDIVNKPVDFVVDDIRKMAKTGSFDNAIIDYQRYEIYIPGAPEALIENSSDENESNVVICKSCGAKNVITPGKDKTCDYCGAPLD